MFINQHTRSIVSRLAPIKGFPGVSHTLVLGIMLFLISTTIAYRDYIRYTTSTTSVGLMPEPPYDGQLIQLILLFLFLLPPLLAGAGGWMGSLDRSVLLPDVRLATGSYDGRTIFQAMWLAALSRLRVLLMIVFALLPLWSTWMFNLLSWPFWVGGVVPGAPQDWSWRIVLAAAMGLALWWIALVALAMGIWSGIIIKWRKVAVITPAFVMGMIVCIFFFFMLNLGAEPRTYAIVMGYGEEWDMSHVYYVSSLIAFVPPGILALVLRANPSLRWN
jgi:hypothetical protein